MARQEVDIGVEGNDGTGDSIRESFRKVNDNFKEIYAVVGKGGQITFTLLSDTPDDLAPFAGDGNAAYIPMVSQDGTEIEVRKIGSNELDETDSGDDTIEIKVSQDGALILKTKNLKLIQDPAPTMGGPLNAAGLAIVNVGTSQQAVEDWQTTHQGDFSIDDVVIDKKFADRNYIPRQLPGEVIAVPSEPSNIDGYTIPFNVVNNLASVPNHGLSRGSDAKEYILQTAGSGLNWTYIIRNPQTDEAISRSSTDAEFDPLENGDSVFIRIRNDDNLEFFISEEHANEVDATIREELRLKITKINQADTLSLLDAEYDSTLEGNFLASQVMPRESVVRRQGDVMSGALILHDHPGDLAGAGTPNGLADKQAVTKLYVDSQSTESSANIYVSTIGDDDQSLAPVGKEGSSLAYAYRTIGAACRKAEAIQIASPFEPGPYMQDIIYSRVAQEGEPPVVTKSQASTFGVITDAGLGSRESAATIVTANLEFIIEETLEWTRQRIAAGDETTVGTETGTVVVDWTDRALDERRLELELIKFINAAILDHVAGITASTLSTRVALEFYNDEYAKAQQGITKDIFVTALDRAKTIVANVVTNDSGVPYSNLQTIYAQQFISFGGSLDTDAADIASIAGDNGNMTLSIDIVDAGVFSIKENASIRARSNVVGNRYRLNFTNGLNDFVDQGDPENTDLRIGKVIRGKTSGAIGKIVSYTQGNNDDDSAELELLRPVEFIQGENLEYGNSVNERQVTIHIETGQYEEDYPIRVPAQTSLHGNEMRRTIVRPKKRTSQSPWSGVYFYRDIEFDGLRGDSDSVTGIADPNLPSDGTPYIDPLTNELAGYFGRHYLYDPNNRKNIDNSGLLVYENTGNYIDAAVLVEKNKAFMIEETIAFIKERADRSPAADGYTIATNWTNTEYNRYRRQLGIAIDFMAADLREGRNLGVLEAQGELFFAAKEFPGEETIGEQSLTYINLMLNSILVNTAYTRPAEVTPYIGGNTEVQYTNSNLVTNLAVFDPANPNIGIKVSQINLLKFAYNENCNPAKRSTDVDVFLMNDATIVRQMSVQGHGGFMTVLDPEGQILTKSPYIQTGSSFSQSINRQAFRGGMLVDAFTANTPLTVTNVDTAFQLDVKGEVGSGLAERKPQVPAPFYINGSRYQVNDIIDYDDGGELGEPTATLLLDPNSGPKDSNGDNIGFTFTPGAGGYDITLQTAGNRSQLGNDFTQVNDLGYGLVTINGALSEMVSMFTYYCHGAYYAANGGQIRSTNGSNCNGVYGLIAEGSDPNEVPDSVVLDNDMTQSAKTFSADLVIELPSAVSVAAGATVSNAASSPTGSGESVFASNGKKIYLTNVTGSFAQGNDVFVNGVDSGVNATRIDSTGYSNLVEQLSMYVWETEHVPTNSGEVSVEHSDGTYARYEVATVEAVDGIIVDGYTIDSTEYTSTYTARGTDIGGVIGRDESDPTTEEREVTLVIQKVQANGGKYKVGLFNNEAGDHYKVGDTFSINGGELGGTTPANNATVTVTEVSRSAFNIQNNIQTGNIRRLTITGTPNIISGYTPQRSGQVYKLNFSTSNDTFDNDGLITEIPINEYVSIRQNSTHIFREVESIDTLTIRPSTAINFQDDPADTYRSISFGRNDAIGTTLFDDQTSTGFDAGYDYIRLFVDQDNILLTPADIDTGGPVGTTLGSTAGDTTIAIDLIPELREIWRLNNNLETDLAYKPPFTDDSGRTYEYSAELPKVIDWKGKKHYVYNYREVEVVKDSVGNITARNETQLFGEANSFALVDVKAISEVTLTLNGGSHSATWSRLNQDLENAIVRQNNNTGAYGKVKIAGENSTELVLYEWSGVDFNTTDVLEIATNVPTTDYGTFNDPNIVWTDMESSDGLGTPIVPSNQDERDTNLTTQTGDGITESLALADNANVLRAGLQDGSPAKITINISTCRATGHDFLDIGTGSYNQTNYPNVVLGFSATDPDQGKEVQERNKGRVFYMSTDQDGFFRVGRFFTVDQGTGTVTFAASIALSDVDGIGFKRGVVVSEFSSDTAMSDNAIDSVPTESAVRGYVSRRLGFNQDGNVVTNPLGPSVLTQNGAVPLTGDLSAGSNTITNISPVDLDDSGDYDAVPKVYVDSRAEAYNKVADLRDVTITDTPDDEILGFSKTKVMYVYPDGTNAPELSSGRVLTDQGGNFNYGTIRGARQVYDEQFGSVTIVTFEPGPDTFATVTAYDSASQVPAAGQVGANDIYEGVESGGNITVGGVSVVVNGPYDEVINIAEEPFQNGTPVSDIGFTTRRLEDDDTFNSFRGDYDAGTTYQVGNIVDYEQSLYQATAVTTGNTPTNPSFWNAYTDTVRENPTAYIDFQINDEVIVNQDVNPDAEIVQSKLKMQEADVFVTDTDDIVVIGAAEIEAGVQYEIVAVGNTNFTSNGANTNTVGTTFTASEDGITAGYAASTGTVKRVLTAGTIGALVDDGLRNNQAKLGLSKFDGANFKVTRGHVQLKDNGVTLSKIQKLAVDTVIGNSTGSIATPTEVTFNTVVDEGGGMLHTDLGFTNTDGVAAAYDSDAPGTNNTEAGVITRTGDEAYSVVPDTTTGTKNSYVKTDNTGRVTANTVAIGQNTDYDILSTFDTNGINITTPQGANMFSAQYDTNASNPVIYTPASINVGNLTDGANPFAESVLQAANADNESWVASNWAYHQFIESPEEKGNATTGIAIGAGSGKSLSGQVAIVVANSTNSTSPIVATFSKDGILPDSNKAYAIGSNTSRYGNTYVASLSADGSISTTGTNTISAGGNLSAGGTLSVTGATTLSSTLSAGNTTVGTLQVGGNITATGSYDIGSSSQAFDTVYGTNFTGTAAQAKFADLAEMYVADAQYEPGTVLVFGGEAEVTQCASKGDSRVAGVVSTDPAYLMNSGLDDENAVALALTGRVPCKVIGVVRKGDILVTSAVPGYAIVDNNPSVGTIVGKAIENKDDNGKGVIEVVAGRV